MPTAKPKPSIYESPTLSTQRVRRGRLPSIGTSVKEGHSHCPPVAPAGPNSLSRSHRFSQVSGAVELHLVLVGECNRHDPPASGGGPEDVRVAEVRHIQVEDGIGGVLGPSAAAVVAVGQVLGLERLAVGGARRV